MLLHPPTGERPIVRSYFPCTSILKEPGGSTGSRQNNQRYYSTQDELLRSALTDMAVQGNCSLLMAITDCGRMDFYYPIINLGLYCNASAKWVD